MSKPTKTGRAVFALFAILGALLFPSARAGAAAASAATGVQTTAPQTHTITYDKYSLIIDGHRQLIYAGEFHPFRLPSRDLWLDVLEKMKAAGFNAVTMYFDWDYHSPAPGVYDFSGVRDMDKALDMAAQAGLYVIARPGPYINAETDGGGLPGWWNDQPGAGRSDDPAYLKWALQWMSHIDAILARHQLTNGTGSVILEQVENEFTDTSSSGTAYMAALENQIRSDGITVPLTGNHWNDYVTGQGAVQIPGWDSYPDGFDCSAQSNFYPADDMWWLHSQFPNSPAYVPEYQGGSFDDWGGAGYAACRSMVGSNFIATSARDLIASGVSMLSYYMTYGGTSWGYEPYPGGYSSYDYGAAIDEARQLTPKYYDQKRVAYLVGTVPALAQLDRVSSGAAPNAALNEIVDDNPSTGTHLYLLQHANDGAATDDSTTITVSTADGTYTVPQQSGTAIHVPPHNAKLLLADYDLRAAHVVYSTSELMTDAQIGATDTAVFYGPHGESGETVLRYASQPQVTVVSGAVTTTWDAAHGDLRLDYVHSGTSEVLISEGGKTLELLLADTSATDRLWQDGTGSDQLLVSGPYLVRSGAVHGDTAVLTGDTDGATTLLVQAPAGVDRVTWNGRPVAVSRTASGELRGELAGPPTVSLPSLTDWTFQYGSAETTLGYDDSSWTLANHTASPVGTPAHLPVLYADDYGFHHGYVWYRGHFTATGAETGITLSSDGGSPAGEYEVWLNGAELGTSPSGSKTFAFPAGLLRKGSDNVIAVLTFNSGHEEGGGQSIRGISDAALQGANTPVAWRIQGALGGEQLPDPTRGPLNVSGLDGERSGWYLPGYPDASWRNVTLPDTWSKRGLPSGDSWYRTTFDLNLPKGTDVPIGLQIDDTSAAAYRADIYVNGWQMGIYANDLGPEHVFSLPAGILHTNGHNTIAIAVWALNGASGGLGKVSLVPLGAYQGGVTVHDVPAPGWSSATYGAPRPASQVTLALGADRSVVTGGEDVALTGAAADASGGPAKAGVVTLTAPSGWTATATSSTTVGPLQPGQVKHITWTVHVPTGLAPGTYQVVATLPYRQGGTDTSAAAAASFTVPYPSVSATFDNTGITDDANPSTGDFDGAGYTFSAQALAAAGLTPGGAVTHDGIGFTWPNVAAGQPDNVMADGQAIAVSGQGAKLAFLGASNSGSPTGTGTVVYTDGSTQTFQLTLDDFWFAPSGGNEAVATMPYVNSATGKYQQTVYVFYQSVPIDPAKKVSAVVLPSISASSAGHVTAMHIFAIGVG